MISASQEARQRRAQVGDGIECVWSRSKREIERAGWNDGTRRARTSERDEEEERGFAVAWFVCLPTYWIAAIVSHGSIDRGGLAPMDEEEIRLKPGQGKKAGHESW